MAENGRNNMTGITPERREYLKTQVRELTVMEPNISALRAAEVLKKRNLQIHYEYVLELMKEIDVERTVQADQFFLNHMLMQFMERTRMTDKVLWNILTSPDYDPKTGLGATKKDKLGAARELRNNFNTLFQTMFDAGVFKRKIGELEIHNMNTILDMAKVIENGEHLTKTGTATEEAGASAGVDNSDAPKL